MHWLTAFVVAFAVSITTGSAARDKEIHYAMVIDAGSTGSRAFVFRYFDHPATGKRQVVSYKGKKATPGLSSFASRPAGVTDYFEPVFQHAKGLIPVDYHNETLVYIKGTAGMRLLTQGEQDAIWDNLVQGLREHNDVPFIIHKDNFGTIDGHMEAYYAVLSSNYIAGGIDGNLHLTGEPMVGALDMGGSSTQLILYHTQTKTDQPVQVDDFWSHSWLNFGVEKIRERVWQHLANEHVIKQQRGGADGTTIAANPCAFVGFKVQHESGLELVGTGDSAACKQILLSAAFQSCDPNSKGPCYVDGITHPPIDGLKFYGMSVYYYAFDCIRQLSGVDLPHWPTPTLTELQTAVTAFCHLSWDHVQETMMPKPKGHAWTRDDQLSARCLETTYLITLLHHGFGVGLGDRNIELALEVKGFEVEWTLGFALSEVCLQCLDHHTETEIKSESEQSQTVTWWWWWCWWWWCWWWWCCCCCWCCSRNIRCECATTTTRRWKFVVTWHYALETLYTGDQEDVVRS